MVDLMKIDTAERKKQAVPAIESANNSQVAATAIKNTGHSPRYEPDRAREKGRNGQAREPCANAFGHQDVQFASDAATADEQKRVRPNRPAVPRIVGAKDQSFSLAHIQSARRPMSGKLAAKTNNPFAFGCSEFYEDSETTWSTGLRWGCTMQYLKAICGLGCLLILASNVWTMSHWSETRGVNDDFCYLRQAHLFQKYGFGGFDTNILRDDDQYLSTKMKETNLPKWINPAAPPCHNFMPSTNKLVIQFPPGTGLVLALFPQGHQVVSLFVSATIAIFGFGLLAIAFATTTLSILLTAAFADVALYMMINPTKASYSMAPTIIVCALVGFLTAHLYVRAPPRHRLILTTLIGFLIGLGTNFRLANLLLSAGYFMFFGFALLRSRKLETFLHGGMFGMALLLGMAPTLVANAINAGSPLATTYGPVDTHAPYLDTHALWAYVKDLQFFLVVLASGWTILILRLRKENGIRSVAVVTAGNLLVNLAFFLNHLFQSYYMIPIAALSLWSLLFASLMQPAGTGEMTLSDRSQKPITL